MKVQSEWMVQTWEDGGWVDYWPVAAPGESRRKAVERGPRVFRGEFAERYASGSLRWRVGRKLRSERVPTMPRIGCHA